MRRPMTLLAAPAALAVAILLFPAVALAQDANLLTDLIPEDSATFSGRIIQGIILLTVLSLAPGILITTTCFTRFIIAFSFLRSGLGLQSTPSNLIVISLSIFMTYFVMEPVFQKSWQEGIQPLLDNNISREQAYDRVVNPFKGFMVRNVRPADIALFEDFRSGNRTTVAAQDEAPESQGEASTPEQDAQAAPEDAAGAGDAALPSAESISLGTIIPAFMLSELRRGFEIGFLILLPFLVIDLVVATVTMSMGMMMLPPTVVALPFKVLFFVLIDGWNLLVGELLESVTFVI
ncbi:MAG: flagellar type III secretion system pore protein FliP [Phyllobacteriaceae bacterium]|nr:flagellar type III secretion system pore protein FliP [Phyllobacteriaceae bacterium]